jgi:hypothetical protein
MGDEDVWTYRLPWERIDGGDAAFVRQAALRDRLSQSQARGILHKLMHDVVAIDVVCSPVESLCFERCFEVSVQEATRAEHLGVYVTHNEGEPIFALRRFIWSGPFDSFRTLLANVRSHVRFIRLKDADDQANFVLASLVDERVDAGRCEFLEQERDFEPNSRVSYFVHDKSIRTEQSYRRRFAANKRIESAYEELCHVYASSSANAGLDFTGARLEVKYQSDWIRRLQELGGHVLLPG